ncbi:TIGR01459 family HAD-type hydrolase [Martelella alba]|uniref:TIGR01459 family HAD-type hydrolase n=1 Tax=Martelella alba TaxID=2590451 RepID=A0A506UAI1_9HYPH|nr:TIGR01459 family HAD-type hydrolase [Martelella alba]TPW30528.1 TIGR01459 family HAD-type hydrolase [Martelella alba]
MAEPIEALSTIHSRYDLVLCDVWGVLHNGVKAYPEAPAALASARKAGVKVVLLTNSPRLCDAVATQLLAFGITDESYDAIVTSGDVTKKLIVDGPKKLFYLGPERDTALIAGTGAEIVSAEEAEGILCTGLFDDETETPEDYRDMLTAFRMRGLPFICANPDLIVTRGDRLVPCAGALAALYEALGGETLIAGKPHKPIYDAAVAKGSALAGRTIAHERIVAIGDGMPTDVRGARNYGLDLLFICEGIHAHDYTVDGVVDEKALTRFLTEQKAGPKFWLPLLR